MTLPRPKIRMLIVLLAFVGQTLAGEIYTWTDEDGNVHITDRPPANTHPPVENVIRYSSPSEPAAPSPPVLQETVPSTQAIDRLKKRLNRLKQRKDEFEEIIEQNETSIAAAEKEAATYHKRSGSYARRNVKLIERELLVLRNNLTTYQSELKYVEEDIAETGQALKTIEVEMNRPSNRPVSPIPSTR